ncbi:MAG TPA: pilin [Candidatus Eisenbacteria bacterium]|nr:pilin [Candidatus Eisenbacteria bacterium]
MTADKKGTYHRLVLYALGLLLMTLPFITLPNERFALATNDAPAPTNTPAAAPSAPRRTSLVNPLGTSDIKVLVGRAANGFLGLSGSFALLMFVYGSFTWITSGGSADKIARGKKIFVWAVIGLIVIFGSYAFLSTFINALNPGA